MLKLKYQYIALLCLILIGMLSSISTADIVTLNDGTRLTSVIVLEDAKSLVIETKFGSMTLQRKAVISIDRDTNERNLILRGDFGIARKDYDSAMKYYQEAMMQFPNSREVRDKYRQLRDLMDKSSETELMEYGKKDETTKELTSENREVAERHLKTKKKEPLSTLILYGFGAYPLGDNYRNPTKTAIDLAKLDALKKAFGDAVGIGFVVTKGKLKILPTGELPGYQMKVLEKQKVGKIGYSVKLQVQCPPSLLLFTIPDNAVEHQVMSSIPIPANKKLDYEETALQEALRQAILNAMVHLPATQPKTELTGRIFLDELPIRNTVDGFYQVKIKGKVWFDLGN